ncbi:MAG: hypothetical protein IPM82_11940 [Saprospiraceae bacterium]|nr:hypothetical protein [Saprospiraceae bacterium]
MKNLLTQEISLHKGTALSPVSDLTKWYALYTRSASKKKVYNDLLKWKYHAFLPLVKRTSCLERQD